MNRALRRHHDQRIKKKVKSYHNGVHKDDPAMIGFMANTRVCCSGPCCGNPRKHFKDVTKQEKIHDLTFEMESQ